MAMLTIRKLPDSVHRALRMQAALHGHSMASEVREILAKSLQPEVRIRMGDALAELSHNIGLSNEDFEVFEKLSDKKPANPREFE